LKVVWGVGFGATRDGRQPCLKMAAMEQGHAGNGGSDGRLY